MTSYTVSNTLQLRLLLKLTLNYATNNSICHTAGHFGLDRKMFKANDASFSTCGCVLDESFEKCLF